MEMECTPDYERPIASPASDGLAFRINLSTFLYDKDVNVAPVIWDRRLFIFNRQLARGGDLTPPRVHNIIVRTAPRRLYNGDSNFTMELRGLATKNGP